MNTSTTPGVAPSAPTAPTAALDPINPIARARRSTLLVGTACGVLVGLALTWCFWPLETDAPSSEHAASTSTSPASQLARPIEPFNLAAFDAALWTAPPPIRTVAAAPPALPPPPPLKLQLLGIFQVEKGDSAASYRALLYDPEQDKVVIVASGDSIAQHTVDSVGRHAVTFRDTAGVRTLALRPDQPAGATIAPTSPSEVRR